MDAKTTARLRDANGVEIILPQAWPMLALRPYTYRWCRQCASADCQWADHQVLTFYAAMLTDDGWVYETRDQWHDGPPLTTAIVINAYGDQCGTIRGTAPWPAHITWKDQPCELWCQDARGMVLYLVKDASCPIPPM